MSVPYFWALTKLLETKHDLGVQHGGAFLLQVFVNKPYGCPSWLLLLAHSSLNDDRKRMIGKGRKGQSY